MQNIGNNEDPDQMARREAALAAQDRARQVAGNIAAAHAAGVYNQARQNAVGYNPAPPGYVPPPPGHPLPTEFLWQFDKRTRANRQIVRANQVGGNN